ncbi:4643_t:CDS:1, partial [Ambispora leptoticha]
EKHAATFDYFFAADALLRDGDKRPILKTHHIAVLMGLTI